MGRGRNLNTLEDFKRALKGKYGLGIGKGYKPWLRVQDVKSKGNKSIIWGLKTGREHHMLSSIESQFFYLAEFSDSVIDIREQYPLLPINLSQKIAASIGINHPEIPETRCPIIMTTDFLLTLKPYDNNDVTYQAVAIKPEEGIDKRTAEKLDIERIWWELLGIDFKFYTGNEITRAQSKNIKWATSPRRTGFGDFSFNQKEWVLSTLEARKYLLKDICSNISLGLNISPNDALLLVKSLIAEKQIRVDLSYSIAEIGVLVIQEICPVQRLTANDYR